MTTQTNQSNSKTQPTTDTPKINRTTWDEFVAFLQCHDNMCDVRDDLIDITNYIEAEVDELDPDDEPVTFEATCDGCGATYSLTVRATDFRVTLFVLLALKRGFYDG